MELKTRPSLPNKNNLEVPFMVDKYQVVSLADKSDHLEMLKALIVEVNQQLMFSRYMMRVPNGIWELVPFTCGINSEMQYTFKRLEQLYMEARWNFVQVLTQPLEKITGRDKHFVLPEPIVEQLKKLFENSTDNFGYFQQRKHVVVFFKTSYEQ